MTEREAFFRLVRADLDFEAVSSHLNTGTIVISNVSRALCGLGSGEFMCVCVCLSE